MVLAEWHYLKQNMACYVVFHVLGLVEGKQLTESQNHRIIKIGKDLKDHPVQPSPILLS